jgi:drug/metabolite transporter superfamily protein YnfA
VLSGLYEIGGGYLVWQWIREGRSGWLTLSGIVLLTVYGFAATVQPANFGQAYAAYGGIFIILSIMWGWQVGQIMKWTQSTGLDRSRYCLGRRISDDVCPWRLVLFIHQYQS